jgi:hypothetical protein
MSSDLAERLLAAIEKRAADARAHLAVLRDLEVNPQARRPRLRACVEAWPGCAEGEYDPRCCRFPKSCSCDIYSDEHVLPEWLEEVEPTTVSAGDSSAAADLRRCEADKRIVQRYQDAEQQYHGILELFVQYGPPDALARTLMELHKQSYDALSAVLVDLAEGYGLKVTT